MNYIEFQAPADLTADSGVVAANVSAVATVPAPGPGKRVLVKGVTLSCDSAPSTKPLATLVDGAATNRGAWLYSNNAFLPCEIPMHRLFPENSAATLTFPASGAGTVNRAQLHYRVVSA